MKTRNKILPIIATGIIVIFAMNNGHDLFHYMNLPYEWHDSFGFTDRNITRSTQCASEDLAWLEPCIDVQVVSDDTPEQLEAILEYCIDSKDLVDTVGLSYYNDTHRIDTVNCEWKARTDFTPLQITGKMAQEICSITGGECPSDYPANVLDDGSMMVGVTIWNAETNSEKSYVFTILNDTLSYKLNQSAFDLSKITSMRPNSMEFFYYPNPEDVTNRDVFQKFVLIRLPEELGGSADDVSAFRAYSAVSLSDHCLVKYWPDGGRQRMENPCWGDLYRAIDGVMVAGVDSGRVAFSPNALPYLELSTDENGSLFVEPPKWTLNENGVIGVGRHVSMQDIRDGSQLLVDSVAKSHPNFPEIPVIFGAFTLTQIHFSHGLEATYLDFSPVSDYLYLRVDNVSAQDQQYFKNLVLTNSEVWQIGNTPILFSGSGFDKNEASPYFRQYKAEFILDGFTFTMEGKNAALLKRGIVSNFFPDYTYDDLFLVSSTVK